MSTINKHEVLFNPSIKNQLTLRLRKTVFFYKQENAIIRIEVYFKVKLKYCRTS